MSPAASSTAVRFFRRGPLLIGRFDAMGCSCEILVDTDDLAGGRTWIQAAHGEAQRIEAKFSRYREGNIVHRINTSEGAPVDVDDETARLLDFADRCHRLSDGLFDITSGVLRKAWRFNGSDQLPANELIQSLLPLVGWNKARWQRPTLQLHRGMEIDLGGVAKEYAVDRANAVMVASTSAAFLVNFGGDIAARGTRRDGTAWAVGIEDVDQANRASDVLSLTNGAVATSGDSKRNVVAQGKRYGHILDPRNGWPVEGSPRSVTVQAPTCTEAGFLSTLAILHGRRAKSFLEEAGVPHSISGGVL